MSLAPRIRHVALALGLLAPLAATAQPAAPPSAEGAKALETDLRGWLTRTLGMALDVSSLPLKVVADGENYRMEVPFGGSFFDDMFSLADGAFAATVKPLDGGRWAILSAAMPMQVRAEVRNAGAGGPASMLIGIEKQETTGIFDPTYATPGNMVVAISGYTTEMKTPTGQQSSRIDRLSGRSDWTPSGPGRVSVTSDSTVEKYTTASPMPDGTVALVSIDRMGGATRMRNLDIEGVSAVMRAAMALGAAAKPDEKGVTRKSPKPDEKAMARELLGKMIGLLDAVETEYFYEGVKVEAGPSFSGSLRRGAIGFAFGAPDGKAGMKISLAMEGLDSPMIPDGVWRDYMPQKVALTPSASGVSKEALVAYLRRAIDTEGANLGEEALQLLEAGPLVLGLNDIAIDMGPLRLRGGGAVRVVTMDEAAGEGELRATGLDAMIRRANTTPELKMVAPALIFLKGIGKQVGEDTVWAITYVDRKVMVNDTDLSDLIPSK